MRRAVAAIAVAAAAATVWLAVFLGGGYAVVRFAEAREGDISECDRGQCGTLGEFLDDHDLLAVSVLALVAALPAAVLLWRGRGRFTR